MQTANIFLALGGKRGETVPKYGVTVAEVAVLRFLHGDDAVYDVNVTDDDVQRTARQEIERLRQIYSRQEGDRLISPAVNALFPGVGAQVPQKFSDLELPDELFIVASRKIDAGPLDHDGDGRKGGSLPDAARADLGLAGMTIAQLRTHASKYPDLDLAGITRKEDIREAIELYEASAPTEPVVPAEPTGNVFE